MSIQREQEKVNKTMQKNKEAKEDSIQTRDKFEGFVNKWIENAQGATCVQMTTYSCAANTANCTAVAALTPALTGPYA